MHEALIRSLLVTTCLALITSCVTTDEYTPSELVSTTKRTDGSTINWQLSLPSGAGSAPVLFIAQGSGCAPTGSNENIELLKPAMPEYAVLMIEKYGVEPGVTPEDPMNGCSNEYYENHTITRRVDDAKLVLKDLRSRMLWDEQLILFGGSEGGAVVSILSHEIDDVDAAVVFSTGTGLTMAEFFPMVVPPTVAQQMQAVFDQARSNPMSPGVAGGNSLRWWADILDRRLSDDLLKSAAPILLIHGENDRHAPVAAARATKQAFADAGQADRLTYWELADRDHQMRDEKGKSHMAEVFQDVAAWIHAEVR